jgi:hypothetical protein
MNADMAGSLFWLLFSILAAIGAWRLGLGTPSAPGSGFIILGASVLLGVLSIINFIKAVKGKGIDANGTLFRGTLWRRILFVFLALLAYAKIIPFTGYNITTFLLMTFLFWITGRQKIWKVILYSIGTTAATYFIFSKVLNLHFPPGPFGF